MPELTYQGEKNMSELIPILNNQSGYFIFLDLSLVKLVDVKDIKACLYLRGSEYKGVV